MSRSPLVAMPFLDTPAPPRTDRRSRSHPATGGALITLAAGRRAVPSMHFSRPRRHDRPADAAHGGQRGEGRRALGRPPPPCEPPSLRRTGGGGGGWAWGSCGRSGRHALGRAAGASCVQRLDDSRNSAIHTTYRISLRSSSLQEPRYPLLRVVAMYFDPPGGRHLSPASVVLCAPRAPPPPGAGGAEGLSSGPVPHGTEEGGRPRNGGWGGGVPLPAPRHAADRRPRPGTSPTVSRLRHGGEERATAPPGTAPRGTSTIRGVRRMCVNDPSAGSPTETLLRLLLPLNDKA